MSNAHDVAHAPKHPYHLVEPSRWPIVGAIAAGLTTVGAVMFMHGGWPWLLPIGFILILYTMFGWFRDVVREATFQHLHTPIVQLGLRYGMLQGLALTILLGATFTCIQAYEYTHAEFAFRQGIYPTTFFMATGFHGFHVIVGTIFLTVCWFRGYRGDFTPDHHFGFEAAAWYWHFVDVVWLFLFICIYVGSSMPHTVPH